MPPNESANVLAKNWLELDHPWTHSAVAELEIGLRHARSKAIESVSPLQPDIEYLDVKDIHWDDLLPMILFVAKLSIPVHGKPTQAAHLRATVHL